MVEAAIIQVDGSYHSLAVVGHEYLRMHESGGVLVDLHPGIQQFRVGVLRERIGEALVGDAG